LEQKDIGIIQRNKINETYFEFCKEEFEFIHTHWRKVGQVPDIHTFLAKYPDFEVFKVGESEEYLVNSLREQYVYNKIVPILKEGDEKLREDSFDAVDFLRAQLREIAETLDFRHVGHNLAKDTDVRKDDYLKRMEMKGLTGIPTGLEWLDDLTNGWQEEDFVMLGGYLGEGKSWLLLFLLWAAWGRSKKKVLLISREMGKVLVGFRFDTWNGNFSNLGLMKGNTELGKVDKSVGGRIVPIDLSKDDYIKYLEELKDEDNPDFMVYTNEDNAQCTFEDIENLIDIIKPDIVGIDQLSLIGTVKKFGTIRERYIFLTRNFYRLSSKKRIPILVTGQIGRDWAKGRDKNKKNGSDQIDAPETHQFMESNSAGEDATRVVTFARKGNIVMINVPKNRYGIGGKQEFVWDIDRGFINLFDRPEEEEDEQPQAKRGSKDKKENKVIQTSEYIF
jgi:replicative DNA helicase